MNIEGEKIEIIAETDKQSYLVWKKSRVNIKVLQDEKKREGLLVIPDIILY